MDFSAQVLTNRRALIDDLFGRIEEALWPFAIAVDEFLGVLFETRLPADWRQHWRDFVTDQATKGFVVEPESASDMEIWIEAWAGHCGLLPAEANAVNHDLANRQETEPTVVIPVPTDYPRGDTIAFMKALDDLERRLLVHARDDRSNQVIEARRAVDAKLRRTRLLEDLQARKLSPSAMFAEGLVAGFAALRAAATHDPQHISARDAAFKSAGIDGSASETASVAAASVAVAAGEAAVLLAACGATLGPILEAYAAYSPTGAIVSTYAAQGLGGALVGAKMQAAYRAYSAGNTQEAIDHAAQALVMAILVIAGPFSGATGTAAAAPRIAPREVPLAYIDMKHVVDMTNAPASSRMTAAGFPRNGPWFWREMLKRYPHLFSPVNRVAIRAGRSPLVDSTWIQHNPSHQSFDGDRLIHHHIDQGPTASGLPERIDRQWYNTLHPVRELPR